MIQGKERRIRKIEVAWFRVGFSGGAEINRGAGDRRESGNEGEIRSDLDF